MPLPREKASHPAYTIFGSEARTRVAFAFIPDPKEPVSISQLSDLLDKPQGSLRDAVSSLHYNGLLEKGDPNTPGSRTFERIESPLWAIYETAKIAFNELGIEAPSLVEVPASE